jgi:hypothetical protein
LFFVSSSFISGLMLPLLLANVDTLRWATVAIPNPTRHYGWSTLEQDWKPTGRLTYYTIAWPNGRAVCRKKKKGKKKMMFPSAIFSFPLDGGDRCVRQRCQIRKKSLFFIICFFHY